jgi:hypothetical protein
MLQEEPPGYRRIETQTIESEPAKEWSLLYETAWFCSRNKEMIYGS